MAQDSPAPYTVEPRPLIQHHGQQNWPCAGIRTFRFAAVKRWESSDVLSPSCMFISFFSFFEITSHSQVPTHWPASVFRLKSNNVKSTFWFIQKPHLQVSLSVRIQYHVCREIPPVSSNTQHTRSLVHPHQLGLAGPQLPYYINLDERQRVHVHKVPYLYAKRVSHQWSAKAVWLNMFFCK